MEELERIRRYLHLHPRMITKDAMLLLQMRVKQDLEVVMARVAELERVVAETSATQEREG